MKSIERTTLATFNYPEMSRTRSVILCSTTSDNTSTSTFTNKDDMHKYVWRVAFSPRIASITINTGYYSKDIASLMSYCEMVGIDCLIRIIRTEDRGTERRAVTYTIHTSSELTQWLADDLYNRDITEISKANEEFINNYCKELKYFLNNPIDLIEFLTTYINEQGYDVSSSSLDRVATLNHGEYKGKTWSRNYTKYKDTYNTMLSDLLNMYVNVQYYKANNIPASRESIEQYDELLDDPCAVCGWKSCNNCPRKTHVPNDEFITPMSACGEYVQMYMN